MFYVPKAIKAIFLSALIGTISVQQSHLFPWGFQVKCALPFLFIFTLQTSTKGGSKSAYKWAGQRPGDQERLAGESLARGPVSWCHPQPCPQLQRRCGRLWFCLVWTVPVPEVIESEGLENSANSMDCKYHAGKGGFPCLRCSEVLPEPRAVPSAP